jgi:undecaprenyl pyrophosphate phosphatase UppP
MFSPVIASAQLGNVTNLIESVRNIIDILIPLVAALALLYFFWGLAQFILNSGSDDAKTEAKNKMIWGIVALFVMVSVWGLVRWLGEAIGVNPGTSDQPIPGVGN